MQFWRFVSLIIAVEQICLVLASNDRSCPTWFYHNNVTNQCECGHYLGCSLDVPNIHEGYCATTSGNETGKYYIGSCPYRHAENVSDRVNTIMPDPDVLDEVMCGPYKRRGLLCGECKYGHGPILYQLDVSCAKCSKGSVGYAVAHYIALELVPITLLFVCMVLFRINITSGPLFGYLIFWQLTVIVATKYVFIFGYIDSHVSSLHRTVLKSSLIPGLFLSLNFILKPFCISENFTGIHIQLLNLLSAVFPFILVIITCILMELHARNCRIIHILWKPFSIILNKTNTTAVTGDAVIQAFASLIFLSYFSVYSAVANVLTGTMVKRILVVKPSTKYFLYIDPTIEWLSPEHIQYIVIVAVPFIIVTLIPSLLLTLYPTRLYSRYLSRFISARKRLAITAFCEALHKCFKDGLNGTKDYRAFPGLMLVIPVLYLLFKELLGEYDPDSSIPAVIFLIFLTFSLTYIKPCKSEIANFSLCFHVLLLTILLIVFHLWTEALYIATECLQAMFTMTFVSSHLMVLSWACYKIIRRLMTTATGCHFNSFRVVLTHLGNTVKRQVCCRRRGYAPMC